MQPIEIVLVLFCALVVVGVVAASFVRRKRGKPGCGCDCADCGHCAACGRKKQPGSSKGSAEK